MFLFSNSHIPSCCEQSVYLTFSNVFSPEYLLYFILIVQPMMKFHNSKCLQDNAEVLSLLF